MITREYLLEQISIFQQQRQIALNNYHNAEGALALLYQMLRELELQEIEKEKSGEEPDQSLLQGV